MKPIIVFDLDGTIAHTEVYWLPILDRTLAKLEKQYGITRSIATLADALPLLGKPDHEVFAGLFPGLSRSDYDTMLDIANATWMDMVDAHPYVLYPAAMTVIQELHAAGHDLYVASNCDTLYLNNVLNIGLRPYMTDAACAGFYPGLSKAQFTEKMLSSAQPATGYFIGDSTSDMEAGRHNGLTTVYATYGYGQTPPDHLIDLRLDTIGDLPALISHS